MDTGGAPACKGPRLGAHLHGGARVIRCCGEKLGATAMGSTGQHAWTDHCPLPRRGRPAAPKGIR